LISLALKVFISLAARAKHWHDPLDPGLVIRSERFDSNKIIREIYKIWVSELVDRVRGKTALKWRPGSGPLP